MTSRTCAAAEPVAFGDVRRFRNASTVHGVRHRPGSHAAVTAFEIAIVVVAGFLAGGINTVVGSGTLVTFPVLLGIGLPPVVANVSNGLGLVPGSVSGAIGYRRELKGQAARLVRLGIVAALGAVCGALLLLVLPADAFEAVVPALILLALVLVIAQPAIARKLAERDGERHPNGGFPLVFAVFLTAVYGGYFGAAQGVILLALMGILMDEDLQRLNATKNVFVALANLVSGVVFVFAAEVNWLVVALLAGGSTLGGIVGARIGRRLRPFWLRATIVAVGTVAIVQLMVT